jgi:hypothetical protein
MSPHLGWFPGDDYTIQTLYDEQNAARRLARDAEQKDRSDEWRVTEYGAYNRSIYVGLDLGKKSDYTAMVFLEPFLPTDPEEHGGKFVYDVSRIARIPLDTPYPKIARLLKKTYGQLVNSPDFDADYIHIVVDEGGVGTAVTDQVVELIPNADIYRVSLTGGLRPRWVDARSVNLPKEQMVSTLIALMESRRLWVAADDRKAFEELKDELDNYQLKITQEGHDQYGALKIGQHDDIASAIGLAAWIAEDFGAANAPLIW